MSTHDTTTTAAQTSPPNICSLTQRLLPTPLPQLCRHLLPTSVVRLSVYSRRNYHSCTDISYQHLQPDSASTLDTTTTAVQTSPTNICSQTQCLLTTPLSQLCRHLLPIPAVRLSVYSQHHYQSCADISYQHLQSDSSVYSPHHYHSCAHIS